MLSYCQLFSFISTISRCRTNPQSVPSAQSSRSRAMWQGGHLGTCTGLHFYPCRFPQTSVSPSTNSCKRRGPGEQGARCAAWSCRQRFYCRSLTLSCVCLCQPNHSASFLSRGGGNGLAPHHLSGTPQGLWWQQVLPRQQLRQKKKELFPTTSSRAQSPPLLCREREA